MSAPVRPSVKALVTHARATPAEDRAAFSRAVDGFLATAGDLPRLSLVTCHRVELYVGQAAAGPAAPRGARSLEQGWADLELALPPGGQAFDERAAVRHLAAVAVGLDSLVMAEDQVLHQLRASVAASERSQHLSGPLAHAVRSALTAGRTARSLRTGPPRSLADRALAVLLAQDMPPHVRTQAPLLIVGTGEMGRRAITAARRLGLSVVVASRRRAHARDVATPLGLADWPFDPGARLDSVHGVIVALRGDWSLRQTTATRLAAAAVPVVDLSFPPAVGPGLGAVLGPRLITADALAASEPEGDGRLRRRLEALVDQVEAGYTSWIGGRAGAGAAHILTDRAAEVRRRALERLWRQSPSFAPAERERIGRMARQLTDELLGAPISRLGRDGDGSRSRAARDLFDL